MIIDLDKYNVDVKTQRLINSTFKKKFLAFVQSVWGSTPFLDKPNKSSYGSSASIGVRTKYPTPGRVTIYGGRPNVARMKGYLAPVNEYIQTDLYKSRINGKYYSLSKYQRKAANTGPYHDISTSGFHYKYFAVEDYMGSSVPVGFSLSNKGMATLTYWENTIMDYVEEHYSEEIRQLLDDSVWEVLNA